MIRKLVVRNFKSLAKVRLDLDRFNCLIGMNGAGKSTVLQAFDFLSNLFIGDIDGWLEQRGWDIGDLNCKLLKESNIQIGTEFRCADGAVLRWQCAFNRAARHCTSESLTVQEPGATDRNRVFDVSGRTYNLGERVKQDVAFTYQGSLLSALKDSELPRRVHEFRDAMRTMRSLELLSPHLLRKRSRVVDRDIGQGGEKLSAYLDTIKGDERARLLVLLKQLYPALQDFKVTSLRAGWKKLSVIEQFGHQRLETEALHMNDGLLRILAVLAQTQSDRSLVLLDEIENGINQEVVQPLVEALVASDRQILLTTHSPLILNYLSDEVAREGVQFIYKSPAGETRVRPFFKIPRIDDKLRTMGPGDAFVDTDLRELTRECVAQDAEDEAP